MNTTTASRAHNIALGVTLIIAAALTISIQDVIFKLFSHEFTLWQIFTLRGLFAVSILIILGYVRGSRWGVLRSALGKWPMLRATFITMTFLAFYAAIPFLSLSTVGAANYIAPIFITLLSAYVVCEAVGIRGWTGVLLGFTGVVVLLQPGTDAFSAWALLPVLGAAFYACAHITTRVKCQNVSVTALSLSQNFTMLLAGLIISMLIVWLKPNGDIAHNTPYLFGGWSSLDFKDWMVIFLLAAFAVVIGMMLAGAYIAAPPSTVATFEYSYLLFVALWDILFFNITPTIHSMAGIAMIVCAGLLVLHRKPN